MFFWKRMGTLSPRTVLAGFGFAGGALATAKVIATVIGGQGETAVPIVGLLCLWMIATYRFMRIGLYVSQSGLRVRTVGRAQTIPWSTVASIDVVYDSLSDRDEISIALTSGGQILTPVWATRQPGTRGVFPRRRAHVVRAGVRSRLGATVSRMETEHHDIAALSQLACPWPLVRLA